jgi:hypothetical protein
MKRVVFNALEKCVLDATLRLSEVREIRAICVVDADLRSSVAVKVH